MIDAAGDPVPDFSLRVESANARGEVRQVTGDAAGYFEVGGGACRTVDLRHAGAGAAD